MPRSTQNSGLTETVEQPEATVPAEAEAESGAAAILKDLSLGTDPAANRAIGGIVPAEPVADLAVPPVPDAFGRYRVLDLDTGHQLSIHAEALPHGNYEVLDEAASNPATGEPLPPVHKPAVETNPSGQQAENKETLDA
ncbi:hypothetical protein [Nocardioides sp. SLBN-35]|uniref:hypothetical protein n=1 Tax=Nocardioides sp. SLBN-35 TaxID=2768445 RepID=UPI00114E841F|nr:hypothetical protein [Nocardioides sp. SLBN-35]TQK73363.1 hypothetical protein FBY23_5195 [Nocardioides sp. SLBN-35]